MYLQLQYGDTYFRVRFPDREAENTQTEFQVTSVTLLELPLYQYRASANTDSLNGWLQPALVGSEGHRKSDFLL